MTTTFTDKQQKAHRAAFIEECKQKAWGAACNADWIGKQVDEMLANYKKLKAPTSSNRSSSLKLPSTRIPRTAAINVRHSRSAATASPNQCNSSSRPPSNCSRV
jgi:hypothetical protein